MKHTMALTNIEKLKEKNKKGRIAKFEILILVIGIIAFAYSLGQSFGSVSATKEERDISENIDSESSMFCSDGTHYNNLDQECTGEKKVDEETGSYCCVEGKVEKREGVDNVRIQRESSSSEKTSSEEELEKEETIGIDEIEGSYGDSDTAKTAETIDKGIDTISQIKGVTDKLNLFQGGSSAAGSSAAGSSLPTAGSSAVQGEPLATEASSKFMELYKGATESSEAVGSSSAEAASEVASPLFGQILSTVTSAVGSALLGRTIFMKGIGLLGASGRNLQAMSEIGYYVAGTIATAAIAGAAATTSGGISMGAAGLGGAISGATGLGAGGGGGFLAAAGGGLTATGVGAIIVVAVIVIMAIFYGLVSQNYAQEKFTYKAFVWQPPVGGDNCGECNDLRYGCNKYQCKSYGQACVLLNPDSEHPLCVENNSDDESPPTIKEMNNILPEDFEYKPLEASIEDPGLKIKGNQKGECIPPFSDLTFGVKTSEPAKCKISVNRSGNYSDMPNSFMSGEGMNVENHTLYIPSSVTASEDYLKGAGINTRLPKIKKGDEYNYYIRCEDAHGNVNPKSFVINFCVADKDLTPPKIKGTGIGNETYVQNNKSSLVTAVSLNEPAVCKWDRNDVSYDEMSHQMAHCPSNPAQNIGNSYRCYANFTGINKKFKTNYYIRCKDNPLLEKGKRNVMQKSKVVTLKSSDKLVIDSVGIDGKDNNSLIESSEGSVPVELKVKTSGGAENGKSECSYYYGRTYNFEETGRVNSQELNLGKGNYSIPISCSDAAGNKVNTEISFRIKTHNDPPKIERIYKSGNSLYVATDKKSECVYSHENCDYSFEKGEKMSSEPGGKKHFSSWNSGKTFYIKCKDMYGNKPLPRRCSGIFSPFGG